MCGAFIQNLWQEVDWPHQFVSVIPKYPHHFIVEFVAVLRDLLVDFVAEVRKMDVVFVDEAHIVHNLQQGNLEYITFQEFKTWSKGPSSQEANLQEAGLDPFGNQGGLPERFANAKKFVHNVKVQHPCFTTSSHDIGIKKPNQVDMPVKWRGKEVITFESRNDQCSNCWPRCCQSAGGFHQRLWNEGTGQKYNHSEQLRQPWTANQQNFLKSSQGVRHRLVNWPQSDRSLRRHGCLSQDDSGAKFSSLHFQQ